MRTRFRNRRIDVNDESMKLLPLDDVDSGNAREGVQMSDCMRQSMLAL